jgi:adenine-specific DNA-methyltransferase
MVTGNFSDWSKEELVREIKKLKKRKKYGIVWEDKTEQVVELCKEKLPVLVEDKIRNIATVKEKPINILIEGDNYHALSVLNYTHKGKINVIYIDPPYNTGSEGFRFNDKIVDKEDAYRHSKWLSFVSKRLSLAKNLLRNSGVIFVSIDDNESAQLKLLCDEVFGEQNFVASIIWEKKFSPQNDAKWFSDNHDYVLVYAKNKELWHPNLLPRSEISNARYSNPDNDPRGPWTSGDLSVKTYSKEYDYPIQTPSGRIVNPPRGTCWRVSRARFDQLVADHRIWFGKDGNNVPRLKRFLSQVQEGIVPLTIWTYRDAGHTQEGRQEFKEIVQGSLFDNPKPTKLIKRILKIASDKNSIVLDFFAGSGTTGQAVLELNNEDAGNRMFILCTNNENDIATEVCYPRIKNIILGYKSSSNENVKGLGGNLRYFKTDFVDAEPTDANKKRIVDKSTEMLCLKEDCFNEVKTEANFRVFTNHQGKNLGIIYDDDGIEPFKEEARKSNKEFVVYVFSLDESAREEEFEDIMNLVKLKPIPAVILNVYRRIFK